MFDLSVLPNAGIKSATLTLHVVTAPTNNRTYGAYLLTSFWDGTNTSWTNRASGTAWGAAGGDLYGMVTSTAAVTTASAGTSISWTLTRDVQSWYNSTANFGTLIRDQTENSGTVRTTIFSSKQDATPANRPSLTINYLQNVRNLTVTPGNSSITLNWTSPATMTALPGATLLEPYVGVVILRRATAPVDKSSAPADGTNPASIALCSTVGNGTVVYTGAGTSFADNTCGGLTNGTMYYYKVFLYDTLFNYTSSPAGLAAPREGSSTYTAEVGAMPNPAGSTQAPAWMVATHSTTLAAPGLVPGSQVDIGADTDQLFGLDASSGLRIYPAVALGGIISGRPPVLDAGDASIAKQAAYVTAQDGFIYAVDTVTGQILWLVNPTGAAANLFQGGAAVQVKTYSGAGFTLANDLVVAGTRNGGTTSANRIVGLNGNTGATIWTYTGSAGATTALDIISSTPTVDYIHNAIWVTSHSNAGAAQRNLWKLNPVTGAVLFGTNLGGTDIDSSPSLTYSSDVLFVGTNAGILYAINPVSGATLGSINVGDGALRGFPYIVDDVSPFRVVVSGSTKVHAVRFTAATNTFTSVWDSPAITSPSAPVVSVPNGKVYVGTGNGFIDELNMADGTIGKQRVVNTFYPAVVGDPGLDLALNRVYVSTTTNDQRAYGFTIPF